MDLLLSLLAPGIRTASPLILAAMGGLFTQRVGVWNIALDAYMLFAAFTGVLVGSLTGNAWLALGAGVAASMITAMLMALLVVSTKADEIIVGISLNLVASFLTAYLLDVLTVGGGFMRTETSVPIVVLPVIEEISLLGQVMSGHDAFVYVSWLSVAVASFIIFRTQLGLQLRAAGEDPESATAAGVNVARMKYTGFAFSGFFAGLAGFQLAVSFLQLFSINMTAGRGIIAFAAVIFGGATPLHTAVAAAIFGFAQALANQLSTLNIPVQFVLMIPYVLTIVALFIAALRRRRVRGVV